MIHHKNWEKISLIKTYLGFQTKHISWNSPQQDNFEGSEATFLPREAKKLASQNLKDCFIDSARLILPSPVSRPTSGACSKK